MKIIVLCTLALSIGVLATPVTSAAAAAGSADKAKAPRSTQVAAVPPCSPGGGGLSSGLVAAPSTRHAGEVVRVLERDGSTCTLVSTHYVQQVPLVCGLPSVTGRQEKVSGHCDELARRLEQLQAQDRQLQAAGRASSAPAAPGRTAVP